MRSSLLCREMDGPGSAPIPASVAIPALATDGSRPAELLLQPPPAACDSDRASFLRGCAGTGNEFVAVDAADTGVVSETLMTVSLSLSPPPSPLFPWPPPLLLLLLPLCVLVLPAPRTLPPVARARLELLLPLLLLLLLLLLPLTLAVAAEPSRSNRRPSPLAAPSPQNPPPTAPSCPGTTIGGIATGVEGEAAQASSFRRGVEGGRPPAAVWASLDGTTAVSIAEHETCCEESWLAAAVSGMVICDWDTNPSAPPRPSPRPLPRTVCKELVRRSSGKDRSSVSLRAAAGPADIGGQAVR